MQSKYLQAVLDKIEDNNAKAAIAEELASHLFDKRDYYVELGYDEAEAMRKAEKDMGEPDDCAVPLNALHRSRLPLIMSYIYPALLLAFLLFACIWWFPFAYGLSGTVSEPMGMVGLKIPVHNIEADFLSLAATAVPILILVFNYKRKKTAVPAFLILFLLLYLVVSWILSAEYTNRHGYGFSWDFSIRGVFSVFQPAFYALFTILAKGFGGYVDSLFTFTETEQHIGYMWCSVIYVVLMIAWAVLQIVTISRQEIMENTDIHRRILTYLNRMACGLLTANLLIMGICAVIGFVQVYPQMQDNQETWKQMVNYTIDTQPDRFSDSEIALLKNSSSPYDIDYNTPDRQSVRAEAVNEKIDTLNGFGTLPALNGYQELSWLEKQYAENWETGTDMQTLLDSDILYKTIAVEHKAADKYYDADKRAFIPIKGEEISFTFATERDSNYLDRMTLVFFSRESEESRDFRLTNVNYASHKDLTP